MGTIRINGTDLQPQPAVDSWESVVTNQNLNGTNGVGAYMLYRMRAPNLAGQVYNWDSFENQVLTSLETHAPADLYNDANVTYNAGVVAQKITKYESPLDNSITGVELVLLVIV